MQGKNKPASFRRKVNHVEVDIFSGFARAAALGKGSRRFGATLGLGDHAIIAQGRLVKRFSAARGQGEVSGAIDRKAAGTNKVGAGDQLLGDAGIEPVTAIVVQLDEIALHVIEGEIGVVGRSQVQRDLLAPLDHFEGVEIDGSSAFQLAGTLGEIIRKRRPAGEIFKDTIRRANVHNGRFDLPGMGNRTQ